VVRQLQCSVRILREGFSSREPISFHSGKLSISTAIDGTNLHDAKVNQSCLDVKQSSAEPAYPRWVQLQLNLRNRVR